VEAQQCVKLTGTNSSIGLIVLINLCPHRKVKCSIGTLNTPGSTSLHGRALNPITDNKTRIHTVCFSLTLWFLRGAQDPIPSRTRPSNSSAPMVLSLKAWESRSLQGLPKTYGSHLQCRNKTKPPVRNDWGFLRSGESGVIRASPIPFSHKVFEECSPRAYLLKTSA
jgi:hypothetical protein